jgi:hypothetical protein
MDYKILNKIESYLKGNYPFALMINGKWGSGKTYFLINELEKHIKRISNKEIENVCYISCNGVKSIDDLKTELQINIAKNKFFKNHQFELIGKIVNTIKSEKLSEYIKFDIKNAKLENKKTLFIIDDIERKSPCLDIEELFGYISTDFTELNDIKVIIVGDEGELLKGLSEEAKENYLRKKEKLVYRTINFEEDISKLIDGLISKNFTKEFKTYLSSLQGKIIYLIEKYNEKNLRTISFFLNNLKMIFEVFNKELQLDEDGYVINTLLVYCIIYKDKGSLYENGKIKHFLRDISFNLVAYHQDDDTEEKVFLRRFEFGEENQYKFMAELIQFVEFGDFDKSKMKYQFDNLLKNYDKNQPWILALNNFNNYLSFDSESSFLETFRIVKDFINENKYSIYQLHYISCLVVKWSHYELITEGEKCNFFAEIHEALNKAKDTVNGEDFYVYKFETFDEWMNNEELIKVKEQINVLEEAEFLERNIKNIDQYLVDFKENKLIENEKIEAILRGKNPDNIESLIEIILKTGEHMTFFTTVTYKYLKARYPDSKIKVSIDNFLDKLMVKAEKDKIKKFRILSVIAEIKR